MYLVQQNALRRLHKCGAFAAQRCRLSDDASKPPAPAKNPVPSLQQQEKVRLENPLARTLRMLRNDVDRIKNFILPPSANEANSRPEEEQEQITLRQMADRQSSTTEFQSHCDILIIGGGGVGASIAYWLKKRAFSGLNVVVLEKDPTVGAYTSCVKCQSCVSK